MNDKLNDEINVDKLRLELRRANSNSPLIKVFIEEIPKLNYRIRNAIILSIIPNLLSNMQRWQPLYKVVKDILNKKGYWREKPRGNPKLGYKTGFGKKKKD